MLATKESAAFDFHHIDKKNPQTFLQISFIVSQKKVSHIALELREDE